MQSWPSLPSTSARLTNRYHTNIAPNASAAESGDYTIKVDGIRENAQVDAYDADKQ